MRSILISAIAAFAATSALGSSGYLVGEEHFGGKRWCIYKLHSGGQTKVPIPFGTLCPLTI